MSSRNPPAEPYARSSRRHVDGFPNADRFGVRHAESFAGRRRFVAVKLQKAERHTVQNLFDPTGLGIQEDTDRGHERRQRRYDVTCNRHGNTPRTARIEVQADGVAARARRHGGIADGSNPADFRPYAHDGPAQKAAILRYKASPQNGTQVPVKAMAQGHGWAGRNRGLGRG